MNIVKTILTFSLIFNFNLKPNVLMEISNKISNYWNNSSEIQKICYPLAAIAGITVIYKTYSWLKTSTNENLEKQILDAIALSLTMNYTISKLPEPQREQQFREKAKLINYRIRIMKKLRDKLITIKSDAHRQILDKVLKSAEQKFRKIDFIRGTVFFIENPYEEKYENPSTIDNIIEDQIVDSIIFSLKPNNECTSKEIQKKKEMQQRRIRILEKLTGKISSIWLQKLTRYSNFSPLSI